MLCASEAQLYTTSLVGTADSGADPYKWTGIVLAYDRGSSASLWRGSGSVVRHRKIVVSCAHVIHTGTAWHTGDYRWFRQWPSNTQPQANQGLLMRAEIRWASYHERKRRDASAGIHPDYSSPDAFDYDITAYWSYEDTAQGGHGRWFADGGSAMRSNNSKMVSGYPSRPFGARVWNMFRTGPFTDVFATQRLRHSAGSTTRYMRPRGDTVELRGNSGGPLWVRDNSGNWGQAGVFVSGGAGVTALDSAAWNEVLKAINAAGPSPQPITDDHGSTYDSASDITPGFSRGGVIETAGDADFFKFNVATPGNYVIETTGSLDTFGNLMAPNPIDPGFVAYADGGGAGANFRMTRTLGVGMHYIAVQARSTGAYTLSVTRIGGSAPNMNVAGLANRLIEDGDSIPGPSDGTHFGSVNVNTSLTRTFTISNAGNAPLSLGGNPRVSITGTGASHFAVTSFPSLPSAGLAAGASSQFVVRFQPSAGGPHQAMVTIANNDPAKSPYNFTISGVGDDHANTQVNATVVTPGVGRGGALESEEDVDFFQFSVPSTADYEIKTTSSIDTYGSLLNSGLAVVAEADDGGEGTNFRLSRRLAAGTYYVRVRGSASSTTGAYSLMLTRSIITAPNINLRGLSNLPIEDGDLSPSATDGTHFGSVNLNQPVTRTFTVGNTGDAPLSLGGNPRVSITGAGASHFTVTSLPAASVAAAANSQFIVRFQPSSIGIHQATVSITSNDPAKSPYTFAISGGGIGNAPDDHGSNFDSATALGTERRRSGRISHGGDEDYFSFVVGQAGFYTIETKGATDTHGMLYDSARRAIGEDGDSGEGLNFRIARELMPGTYLVRISGFGPQILGDYTLEISSRALEPEINVTTSDFTPVPHGSVSPTSQTGTDFGSVLHASGQVDRTFRIENFGFANVLLTGEPRVTVTGAGAAHFQVVTQPAASLARGASSTFVVRYRPTTPGTHNATVQIPNNDANEAPYVFAIRGTGTGDADDHGNTIGAATEIALPGQIAGSIERRGDADFFRFNVTAARTVTIRSTGSTDTFGHLLAANGQELAANDDSSNTDANFSITRLLQPGAYFVRVRGYNDSVVGSYSVQTLAGQLASTGLRVLDNAGRHIAPDSSGAPGADFGNVAAANAFLDRQFTLQNNGEGAVQLGASPAVSISGADAAAFAIIQQPAASIAARGGTTVLGIRFDPRRAALNNATVEVRSNDASAPVYRFAIRGTGTGTVTQPDDHGDGLMTSTAVERNSTTAAFLGHEDDRDWFTFVLLRESSVTISSTGSVDTFGYLYDAPGTQMDYNDDLSGWDLNFRISRRLRAGTYYVMVRGYQAKILGGYSLLIESTDVLPRIEMQNSETNFGSVVAGRARSDLSFRFSNTGQGVLALDASRRVTITGPGAAHFSVITQPPTAVQPGASASFTVRFAPTVAGEHSAVLNIWSNDPAANPYALDVRGTGTGLTPNDDHGNFADSASPLSAGSSLAGNLERSGDADYFRIVVAATGELLVETAGNIDTFGRLYDGNGQEIGDDDDAGADLNFSIVRSVEPGTYFLRVSGYSSGVTGAYTVRAALTPSAAQDDHGDVFASATPLVVPSQASGVLESGGDVDVFRFTLPSTAEQLTIRTTSSSVDTLGELYGANGTKIAEDDDSGGDLNFEIVRFGLPAGTYYIRVRGFRDTTTGPYNLFLQTQ